MQYKIIYDKPCRIRLRMGQGAFSAGQGYGLETLIMSSPGVKSVETSHINGSILICYEPGCRDQALNTVNGLDCKNLPVSQKNYANQMKELGDSFFHSMAAVLCRHYVMKFFVPAPVKIILTIRRAILYWKKGLLSLYNGKFGVDVLDASSIAAAISQKDFKTAASIMTLLNISELLESYTRKKARQTLAQDFALNIDSAWLLKNGEEILTPVSQIQTGDKIHARMGSMIALDGEVVSGEALVNEASMTGEPLGTLRGIGHSVYAGTVVEEGSIVIEVRELADNTRIQNIVSLIEQSESLKASVQSKAEKLADSIVPFSFMACVATFAITRNISKALSILMVDYSCAIKLTTPICVISAIHEASKQRLLVKGGKYLEAYANADTIVFDKTGTLTAACPKVAKIVCFNGQSRENILKISACLEEHFPHSVAKAIVRQAEAENLQHREEHAEVEYVVAHGISSILNGERILIGSWHFVFDDEGVLITDGEKQIIKSESEGYSAVYLSIGGKLAGMVCVEDPVRPEAKQIIEQLKATGIKNIIMITGDGEPAAKAACNALGITEYYSQALPEDKAGIIRSLRNNGHTVIMVGDGINDSPALACADISVAMKDGSDITKEVADIMLLSENLFELVLLRRLSKALFQRIHKNYTFILSFNTLLLLLGLGGMITPASSALLHNISTMALSSISTRPYLEPVKN